MDLIYTSTEKWILSKVSANWKVWQDKFYHYKSSLNFPGIDETVEFLKVDFKISDENRSQIKEFVSNSKCDYFELTLRGSNKISIEQTQLDLLNSKGEIIDWQEWSYFFSKNSDDDFHLWVYVGGIADISREIKLSTSQVRFWQKNGVGYISKLAAKLQVMNSPEYHKANEENRKVL